MGCGVGSPQCSNLRTSHMRARTRTHTHSHALTLCVCALERQVVDASAWLGALGTVCIEFAGRSMGWMRRWRTGLGLGG